MNGFLKNGLLVVGGVILGSLMTQRAIIRALNRETQEMRVRRSSKPMGVLRKDPNGFDNVVFETQEKAQKGLNILKSLIDTFAFTSVNDFYAWTHIPNFNLDLIDVGWTNLESAKIIPFDEGYIIDFPKPITRKVNEEET